MSSDCSFQCCGRAWRQSWLLHDRKRSGSRQLDWMSNGRLDRALTGGAGLYLAVERARSRGWPQANRHTRPVSATHFSMRLDPRTDFVERPPLDCEIRFAACRDA